MRTFRPRPTLELAEFSFRIEFIPGKVNDVADALSRLRTSTADMATRSVEFQDFVREQQAMTADVTERLDPLPRSEVNTTGHVN
eukprot:COSAG02_NODE_16385_length_1087_cov_150.478745_2_plen_84_part_00